jgi:xylose isomerase
VNLKSAFFLVKFLEDVGYGGSRHFDAHAYRTEDYQGVRQFALGCMRTYLILKDKSLRWNADPEIQALLEEINVGNDSVSATLGTYHPGKVRELMSRDFDRVKLGERGMAYERLDQLTVELLLGVR